jgi:FkbM family methyltransferase
MLTIAEHTVDLELLPPAANIIDIGCRGFLFTDALTELGHNVYAIDIDDLVGHKYIKGAIADFDGFVEIARFQDPQATRIDKRAPQSASSVPCMTLKTFSMKCNIEMWDLIKIDVEGAEYEIIMSLEKAPAKQLSIEFHLHTGIYKMHEVDLMIDKLKSLGYAAVQHDYTSQHGVGFNYWDSLFILK